MTGYLDKMEAHWDGEQWMYRGPVQIDLNVWDEIMTRDEFREAVFERDNYRCVNCNAPAVDAHHLIERRLWSDGGYHVDNGASLCSDCHIRAETTNLSVDILRELAGITKKILPDILEDDHEYDKWGNIIMPDGRRMRGPLYYDTSVQKVLRQGNVLEHFVKYVKHPRTPHLPWSNRTTTDDIVAADALSFAGLEVVITEKMDGENTTMYNDYIHARSIDGGYHASRSWVKNFHSQIAYEIPDGYRICGENLYAKHSIQYDHLPSYFLGHSVWADDFCLSWDDTTEWLEMIGITPVPVLARGAWGSDEITSFIGSWNDTTREGYVIRITDAFHMIHFSSYVAKYVRPNHITTETHWKSAQVVKNELV